jgi:hypothetical protein
MDYGFEIENAAGGIDATTRPRGSLPSLARALCSLQLPRSVGRGAILPNYLHQYPLISPNYNNYIVALHFYLYNLKVYTIRVYESNILTKLPGIRPALYLPYYVSVPRKRARVLTESFQFLRHKNTHAQNGNRPFACRLRTDRVVHKRRTVRRRRQSTPSSG